MLTFDRAQFEDSLSTAIGVLTLFEELVAERAARTALLHHGYHERSPEAVGGSGRLRLSPGLR